MTDEEEREENELIHFYQDKVLKLEEENEELKERIKDFIIFKENIVREYENKIEKMECCENCKHNYCHGVCVSEIHCENLQQWECKE